MTELISVQVQALASPPGPARGPAGAGERRDGDSGEHNYLELTGGVADTGDESAANLIADTDAAMLHRHVEELRDLEAA